MQRLDVSAEAAAVLPEAVVERLRDGRGVPSCAVCRRVVAEVGAAVAVTDGERTVAVVTHPECRPSGVAVVDREVMDGQYAEAATSRTHLATGPLGHPLVLVTTVHAGVVDGRDAAVDVLLGAGFDRLAGLPRGPLSLARGWDATVHRDRLVEITGPDGGVFVAGDPGPAPGGDGWWRRAAADGLVGLVYVGGVHGDTGLSLEDVAEAASRDELVGAGVRWRDRSAARPG